MDRRPWLDDVLVACAAALTFGLSLTQPLVLSWDDGRFLRDFGPVQSISWSNFAEIWGGSHFDAYHPLHLLSYWIDVPVFGPSGPVLHTTNLILWCVALAIARRVFIALGLSRGAAIVATLCFGLHPVQVEAVAWATGRKEILAACFAFGALLVHLRASGARRYVGVGLLYAAALLSKTSVLPLPLVIVAMDVLVRERPPRSALTEQLPTALLGGAIGFMVVAIWSDHQMVRAAPGGFAHVQLVGATLAHYVGTLLLPLQNSPLYEIHRGSTDYHLADVLPLVGAALALVVLRGRPRFVLLAFLLLLLPVLNIVPVYWEKQDRYLSFPLFPIAYGLGLGFEWARARRKGLSYAIAALLVTLLAVRTLTYQRAWNGDMALWSHATRVQPTAYYAWIQLGQLHRDEERYESAREAYGHAQELQPSLRLPHVLLFETHLLEDEARGSMGTRRANAFVRRFDALASNVDGLRALAGDLLAAGYRDAVRFTLGRSFDLAPLDDETLERAASTQLGLGREWLARFYAERMTRAPQEPALSAILDCVGLDCADE